MGREVGFGLGGGTADLRRICGVRRCGSCWAGRLGQIGGIVFRGEAWRECRGLAVIQRNGRGGRSRSGTNGGLGSGRPQAN